MYILSKSQTKSQQKSKGTFNALAACDNLYQKLPFSSFFPLHESRTCIKSIGTLTVIHIFMKTDYCQVGEVSYSYTNIAELHILKIQRSIYYKHFAKCLINLKGSGRRSRGMKKTRSGSKPNACSFCSLQPPSQFILLSLWFCGRLIENYA